MKFETLVYKLTEEELEEYKDILTEADKKTKYEKMMAFYIVLRDKYNLNAKKPIEITDEGYVVYQG